MAHFYVYDRPGTLSVGVSSLPSLDGFTSATGVLHNPDGGIDYLAATIDGDMINVAMPLFLHVPGVWTLTLTLTGASETRALPPARIIVEDQDGAGWHTLDSARADWAGAPESDPTLYDLLASAREQVLAFAPVIEGDEVPRRYRAAQVMQARNSWNATLKNPASDTYGSPEFSSPVFPLDWHVKQLLRPARAVPVVA